MQTKKILLSISLSIGLASFAQNLNTTSSFTQRDHVPRLNLDLQLVDVPYLKYSAQSRANQKAGVPISNSAEVSFGDYASFITAPSMNQIISYSSSFYNAMNFGVAKGWNKIVDPNKSKFSRALNAFGSEITAGAAFVLTTKLPFAGGWAHEEFHRNTWTIMGIGSYDHIWEFDLSPDALTYVGSIHDEDLVAFKKNDPAGFVRMGSAGIEAQYLINQRVQTQDFLYNTNLPNLPLYWGNVIVAVDYVNRAHTEKTIEEHTENYVDQEDQLKRDFTGNDFTAWVYDLYNSQEAYADRGIHPSGVGIDRYRDYNDLSVEMLSYVEKIGKRQWLNLANPFHFRIREIKINDNFAFNFAMRHYLTSFGDDTQLELFFNRKNKKSILSLHKYSNHGNAFFFGAEATRYLTLTPFKNKSSIDGSCRLMAWGQPKDQAFFTNKAQLGGLLGLQVIYNNRTPFDPYIELETKTKGWVAGSPYLGEKTSFRFGINARF